MTLFGSPIFFKFEVVNILKRSTIGIQLGMPEAGQNSHLHFTPFSFPKYQTSTIIVIYWNRTYVSTSKFYTHCTIFIPSQFNVYWKINIHLNDYFSSSTGCIARLERSVGTRHVWTSAVKRWSCTPATAAKVTSSGRMNPTRNS